MSSIAECIRAATQALSSSDSPRLDAEVLLAEVLGKDRTYLFTWPDQFLLSAEHNRFHSLIEKRKLPMPVAYLTGEREFYSMDFKVSDDVLVPRAETEQLIELALEICQQIQPQRIIDLGTGSGIIAITVKKHYPSADLWATDIDEACLTIAQQNAANQEVDINWLKSNWYDALPDDFYVDLILSNPPYIAANHPLLHQGDLPAEPDLALSPGPTGMESLDRIISKAPDYLRQGGYLLVEHGYDQQTAVADRMEAHGFAAIRCIDDFNGLPRNTLGCLQA